MGQYYRIVNLDKGEFISPYAVGNGAKWREQAASSQGLMSAVWGAIVCPNSRGGGDPSGDHEFQGRWHGDRVVLVGDYADDNDRPDFPLWGSLYERCCSARQFALNIADHRSRLDPAHRYHDYSKPTEVIDAIEAAGPLTDVSEMAASFLTHEFKVTFNGDGWKTRNGGVDN